MCYAHTATTTHGVPAVVATEEELQKNGKGVYGVRNRVSLSVSVRIRVRIRVRVRVRVRVKVRIRDQGWG